MRMSPRPRPSESMTFLRTTTHLWTRPPRLGAAGPATSSERMTITEPGKSEHPTRSAASGRVRDDRCVLRLLEAARLQISAANVAVSRSGRGCRQFRSSTGFPSSPNNQRNGINARHGDFTAAASTDRGEHGTLSPIHQVSLDEDQFDVGACVHYESTPAQEIGSSSATYRRPSAAAFLRGTT